MKNYLNAIVLISILSSICSCTKEPSESFIGTWHVTDTLELYEGLSFDALDTSFVLQDEEWQFLDNNKGQRLTRFESLLQPQIIDSFTWSYNEAFDGLELGTYYKRDEYLFENGMPDTSFISYTLLSKPFDNEDMFEMQLFGIRVSTNSYSLHKYLFERIE